MKDIINLVEQVVPATTIKVSLTKAEMVSEVNAGKLYRNFEGAIELPTDIALALTYEDDENFYNVTEDYPSFVSLDGSSTLILIVNPLNKQDGKVVSWVNADEKTFERFLEFASVEDFLTKSETNRLMNSEKYITKQQGNK